LLFAKFGADLVNTFKVESRITNRPTL